MTLWHCNGVFSTSLSGIIILEHIHFLMLGFFGVFFRKKGIVSWNQVPNESGLLRLSGRLA